MSYGEALRYQRELRGYSQAGLSKMTKISQQMISYWEADKGLPNIDFYGITVDELIGRII